MTGNKYRLETLSLGLLFAFRLRPVSLIPRLVASVILKIWLAEVSVTIYNYVYPSIKWLGSSYVTSLHGKPSSRRRMTSHLCGPVQKATGRGHGLDKEFHIFCVFLLIFFLLFFKDFIYWFLERGEGREEERERNINQLPHACPQPGSWPTTQTCALTRIVPATL